MGHTLRLLQMADGTVGLVENKIGKRGMVLISKPQCKSEAELTEEYIALLTTVDDSTNIVMPVA